MGQILKIFLLVIFSTSLHSQNYLLNDGEKAWGVKGQYTAFDNSKLYGFSGNFTTNGDLTFELGFGREITNNTDITSTAYNIGVNRLVFKQGRADMPISFALGANYQYNTFNNLDATINSYVVGGRLYYSARLNSKTMLTPTGSLSWGKAKVSSGPSSQSVSNFTYALGLNFMFQKFYLEPRIAFAEGESQWVLTFGYVFRPSVAENPSD